MENGLYIVSPRTLACGKVVSIIPLTYGRARIVIGSDDYSIDDNF